MWTDRQSGEKKERTEWHRVIVWGRQAETCEKFLSKGRLVYVEGRLQTREYQDKDGNRRWTTEIIAQRVQFLGPQGEGRAPQPEEPPAPSGGEAGFDEGFSDEEIPF
jgi:single-strand DNA-binding protein